MHRRVPKNNTALVCTLAITVKAFDRMEGPISSWGRIPKEMIFVRRSELYAGEDEVRGKS